MRVAIIGSGNIGGTLARSLARAGHAILLGAREPAKVQELARDTGASVLGPSEAAAGADAVIVAIPFGGWPQLAAEIGDAVRGKVVIDACNPYPERDGDVARSAVANGRGSAMWVASLLPEAHLAKAFNTIHWRDLADKAGEGFGMAVAADRPDAIETVSTLVRAAGFEPVVAGGLADSARFDPGAPAYGQALSPEALATALRRPRPQEDEQ